MCINKNSRFQTKNEYVWTGVNDPKTARVDPNFLEKYKKIFPFSDKKRIRVDRALVIVTVSKDRAGATDDGRPISFKLLPFVPYLIRL